MKLIVLRRLIMMVRLILIGTGKGHLDHHCMMRMLLVKTLKQVSTMNSGATDRARIMDQHH